MRRHDWSQRCPAGKSTCADLPLPKAKSFNHKDAVVDEITPTVFLVDKDGDAAWRAANPAGKQLVSAADIDYKAITYVIKFDAIDEVGNKAGRSFSRLSWMTPLRRQSRNVGNCQDRSEDDEALHCAGRYCDRYHRWICDGDHNV